MAALKNIDFAKLIQFGKRRGVLLVSALVIVIAPLAGWWFRGGLTDAISQTMAQRSKEFDKINSLATTSITIRSALGEEDSKTEQASLNAALIETLLV